MREFTFRGNSKAGAFDITGDLAREWLRLPANPNGRDQRRRVEAPGQRSRPDGTLVRPLDH